MSITAEQLQSFYEICKANGIWLILDDYGCPS